MNAVSVAGWIVIASRRLWIMSGLRALLTAPIAVAAPPSQPY